MRVTRADEDLVVLLVPVIETIPIEGDVVGQRRRLGLRRHDPPARVLDASLAHAQVEEGAIAQDGIRVSSFGRFEQIGPNIAKREVIDRQAKRGHLHLLRISHRHAADEPTDPARARLDPELWP